MVQLDNNQWQTSPAACKSMSASSVQINNRQLQQRHACITVNTTNCEATTCSCHRQWNIISLITHYKLLRVFNLVLLATAKCMASCVCVCMYVWVFVCRVVASSFGFLHLPVFLWAVPDINKDWLIDWLIDWLTDWLKCRLLKPKLKLRNNK